MHKKKIVINGFTFLNIVLITAGKIKDSPIPVPPKIKRVRRLNLSAIAKNINEASKRITPSITGHIKLDEAACPVALATINGI